MNNNFFLKLSKFIVEKRNLMYFIFSVLIIWSIISIPRVKVNYDIVKYLPDTTETKHSVDIMADEFTTFGSAQFMVSNVTYSDAYDIYEELESLDDPMIKSITFENTDDYYKESTARYVVTFASADGTKEVTNSVKEIKNFLSDYDLDVIATENTGDYSQELTKDITKIVILVCIVIALMTAYTSKSYIEVIIYFIVFGVAALINMGTNFLLGEISFISNSVAVILQLALAIDYAIILSHRFLEEKARYGDPKKSSIIALSKAIPEISSSSLTTISGMIAMMFMQLTIGLDLGIVLTKSIICSLLTVFFLMPGLLVLFDPLMDKTKHRNFVPKITKFTNFVLKFRHVLPGLFIVVILCSAYLQSKNEYAYSSAAIDTDKKTETRIEKENIQKVFGKNNILAVILPKGDYDKQREVINNVLTVDKVKSGVGLANTKINDDYDYFITDNLNIKEVSKVLDIDRNQIEALYIAYAVAKNDVSIADIDNYTINFMDLLAFINEQLENGILHLDTDTKEQVQDAYNQLEDAKLQTVGDDYTRVIFTLDTDVEGPETFTVLDNIREKVNEIYPDNAYLAGESTSSYDLSKSFSNDNNLISILTTVFVLTILLFTFKSIGAPLILILVIQGSVWINFAIPYLQQNNVFFFAVLIVSAIQMGATIDYAIVVTSRFQTLKRDYSAKQSIIRAMNESFPTILTSGSILVIAGFLIAFMVSDPYINSIGLALGRGAVISITSVMIILPQILLLTSRLIDKTSFDIDLRDVLGIEESGYRFKKIQVVLDKKESK